MSLDFSSIYSGRHRSGVVQTAVLSSLMLLVLCGAVCPLPVAASDRDTPAYLIYVDPVTGKYTTTKPDANAQAVSGPIAGSLESSAIIGTAGTQPVLPSQSMKSAFTAVLMLFGLGLASVFFRKQPA